MATRWLLSPVALTLLGCSWSRFDDAGDNTPVVLLEKPSSMKHGFGDTVGGATVDGNARLIVGGSSGKSSGALFDLGSDTNPSVDSDDLGPCAQGEGAATCYFGDRAVGLGLADIGERAPYDMCFVYGVGQAANAKQKGLFGRCQDTTEYTLPVPADVLSKYIEGEVYFQDAPSPLALATDKDTAPALVAGTSAKRLAWFYPPLRHTPVPLTPPGRADAEFGSATAALRLAKSSDDPTATPVKRLIVVAAQEASHVWLFSGDDGSPVGCLGGPSHFGRALASGRVDSDDIDDLVVSDDANVTVISGAALAGLAPAQDITCSLAALPEGAVLASFGCGSSGTIAGCPGGFGAAVEVGDLDGDGDGEVIVGAPNLSVRGTGDAGAVLVYDAEGDKPWLISDQLFLSSRESGDRLGTSVFAAHLKKRDLVVAGGAGRVGVFYCSALGGEATGSRCE